MSGEILLVIEKIKEKREILIIVFFAVLSQTLIAQQKDFPKLFGPYLGQNPPGIKPKVFAQGIIPGSNFHTSPVFSPDGREVYWKMQGKKTITMMKIEHGFWTPPSDINLSPDLKDFRDPCMSPDGKKLFFLSKGRLDSQSKEKENIWFVERETTGWSDPKPLNEGINSHSIHWQVSVASNGNLYFTSRNTGIEDIYFSKYYEGNYQEPVSMGPAINTEKKCETTPYISPDEHYLIFSRWKLNDEKGMIEAYISFRDGKGHWKPAQKIEKIGYCICPQISPDGKYLFYIGEGFKIMWVSATVIEELNTVE